MDTYKRHASACKERQSMGFSLTFVKQNFFEKRMEKEKTRKGKRGWEGGRGRGEGKEGREKKGHRD